MPQIDAAAFDRGLWRPFVVNLSLVILLLGVGLLAGLVARTQQLLDAQIEARARAHYLSILLTRRWNAGYGGVFVEKRPGVDSNPYLVHPDVLAADGRTFTKKNPALMTREISELAAREQESFRFHITSLDPLNPGNAPDAFEVEALRGFEAGQGEVLRKERVAGRWRVRYMAPLLTEEGCLECHGQRGYAVGQVRGGVSVSFDIDEAVRLNRLGTGLLVGFGAAVLAAALGVVYFFVLRLMGALEAAQRTIAELAVTDPLTGLANRRRVMECLAQELARCLRHGHPLGLLMLDVDHFKRVNDTHGHPAGDAVLREVARGIASQCRGTDVAGRFGGEEFLILLPETTRDGVVEVAEKLCGAIAAATVQTGPGRPLPGVTVSIGAAAWGAGALAAETTVESLVKVVDDALYRAKNAGRNQVAVAESG